MSTPTAFTVEDIQQDWPGWNIWRTGSLWMATRRGPKPEVPEGFFSTLGLPTLTLIEDGPRELLAALEQEAALENQLEALTIRDPS